MANQISRKKTARRGTAANFPLFNGYVAGYEKWAREMLVGKTEPFAYESPERFAEGIIRSVENVRFYLDKGAVDHAMLFSVRLGEFIHRMRFVVFGNKTERDKNILFGVMARVANQKRGKKRGEQISAGKQGEHKSWREEAERVWKKRPGASKSTVAGIVKTRLKSPAAVRTIRAVI